MMQVYSNVIYNKRWSAVYLLQNLLFLCIFTDIQFHIINNSPITDNIHKLLKDTISI